VALGLLDPYIIGHYQLEVVNDVFNDVGTPDLVVLPCRTRSVLWCHTIGSLGTVPVPCEWSIVVALHYSCIVAACLHALQALTALPARTSCSPMMTLTSGVLKTCARALGTCGVSYTGRPARLLFILKAHDP
jgi:hypothetical protein